MKTAAHSVLSSIPQPKVQPLIGNILDVGYKTPVQNLIKLTQKYGPIYRLKFPTYAPIILSSYELIAEVADESRFEKMVHATLKQLRSFAGNGLFTSDTDDPEWGQAHRILMPAFGPTAIRDTFDGMLDIADQLVKKWERLGSDTDLDIADYMTRLTWDTIGLCGFGFRFNSFYQREMHPFVDAMARCLIEGGARARRLPLQNQFMFRTRQQYERDVQYMNQTVDCLIAERRKNPKDAAKKDFLAHMLSSADPLTGSSLSDLNIRHQILTFLIAGHETTGGLLSFALYYLLKNKEILVRARSEVDRVLGQDRPQFEHLAQLPFLEQILKETLRIWPILPGFAMCPKEDTVLAKKYEVKKGQELLVFIPMLHRDPTVWGDRPELFNPSHFDPKKEIPQHAWKPFGNGQRACIGRGFAMQESILILSMILQKFDIFEVRPYSLKVKETLTLKPDRFYLRVRLRSAVAYPRTQAKISSPVPLSKKNEIETKTEHSMPLLILFGSNTGSSENFARRIATDGQLQGYKTKVLPLDEAVGKLPKQGGVIIITSSYSGAPPNNAKEFCGWLETLEPGSLAGVNYGVFGCGNRDWAATYQAIPKKIDDLFLEFGAQRLLVRGEADAKSDFFGAFEQWYEQTWSTLEKIFGIDPHPQCHRLTTESNLKSQNTVEVNHPI